MRAVAVVIAALMCFGISAAAQQTILHGTIRDDATGALCPGTVRITDAKGKVLLENASFKGGFRCSGEFTKTLPPGPTRIRVTRGFETQFVEKQFNLRPGSTTEAAFLLKRNVDLRKRGWYAGDSHVHMLHGERTLPVSFDFVATTARAEDLQYLSLAQAWELSNPTPETLAAQLTPRSTPQCVLTWNLEAPKNYYKGDAGRCLGHCWNLGMTGRTKDDADVVKVLMDASAWDYESQKPSFANFESHRLIHEQGGAVFYTHPARWWTGPWGGQGGYPKVDRMRVSNMAVELPLDTLLGPTFDGLDVITGPGEFEANDKAFALWAMLLNHGYRLAATGSSDACFDRPGGGAPGMPRTYTYIPNGFSLPKVTRATAAGHTFATTGPLLIATIDGQPPGSEFNLGKGKRTLRIEGWADGEDSDGIRHLEVLRNGTLFSEYTYTNNPRSILTNLSFQETAPAWYCVRLQESGSSHHRAITSAFFFGPRTQPPPLRANVKARITDADSGALIKGVLTDVEYYGTIAHERKHHSLRTGETVVSIPGTMRLRAEAEGYKPVELSPLFDNPQVLATITTFSDTDLLDWSTFEKVREQFCNVELEFKLNKSTR